MPKPKPEAKPQGKRIAAGAARARERAKRAKALAKRAKERAIAASPAIIKHRILFRRYLKTVSELFGIKPPRASLRVGRERAAKLAADRTFQLIYRDSPAEKLRHLIKKREAKSVFKSKIADELKKSPATITIKGKKPIVYLPKETTIGNLRRHSRHEAVHLILRKTGLPRAIEEALAHTEGFKESRKDTAWGAAEECYEAVKSKSSVHLDFLTSGFDKEQLMYTEALAVAFALHTNFRGKGIDEAELALFRTAKSGKIKTAEQALEFIEGIAKRKP